MAFAWVGLIQDPATVRAICSGKQDLIAMPFQCRTLPKDQLFFLLEREVKKSSPFEAGAGQSLGVKLAAVLKFVANRRIQEEKFESMGRGLPTSAKAVSTLRKNYCMDPSKKVWPVWEIALDRELTPATIKLYKSIPVARGSPVPNIVLCLIELTG